MSHKSSRSRKRGRRGRRAQTGQSRGKKRTQRPFVTDLLILSDGTVLAHNLTPVMAAVLHKLNPRDTTIRARACCRSKPLSSAGAARPPGSAAP
jgi:hypothetical protein